MVMFKGLTTISKGDDGLYSVHCPRGQWVVKGYNREEVFHEAVSEFRFWLDDGLYDSLLKDKNRRFNGGNK